MKKTNNNKGNDNPFINKQIKNDNNHTQHKTEIVY